MSKRIRERIESALALGRMADENSDMEFAAGHVERGTFWGNRAISYYTEAEKLSIAHPDCVPPFVRSQD